MDNVKNTLGKWHLTFPITRTVVIYSLKLDLFILITLVYSAELLTDFSYRLTDLTVSYRDALDRLRVHLNIILFLFIFVSE